MNRGAYYKQKYGGKRQRQARDQEHHHQHHQQERSWEQGSNNLEMHLRQIDKQNYGAYQSLKSREYTLPLYTLRFDKVQTDPYAPPSCVRIFVDRSVTQFPPSLYSTKERRIALCDYLLRKLHQEFDKQQKMVSGNAFHDFKGGNLHLAEISQKILEQNCVILCDGDVEVRFSFELPGRGRTIASERAIQVLVNALPGIVTNALCFTSLVASDVETFLSCYEDQQWLRRHLKEIGLVAFIPDGAILPRESGVSDLPMDRQQAAPFRSPESLRVSLTCPSGKTLTGMGIKRGVTMITGGGYHGKSTLLSAIEHGIYNHIPGDGRENLVCDPSLTKIRAEDGRSIEGTDISPFINNLPFGRDTKSFSTANASGSTSMAANVQEMLEVGCSAMIYDEDTCATNFMIRDKRMQLIVRKEHEPITPLIYKIRALYHEKGVSSILVVGSCGDYVDVADAVIEMRNYEPLDITEHAKEVAARYPSDLIKEGGECYGSISQRILKVPAYTSGKCSARTKQTITFDKKDPELSLLGIESLAVKTQTNWIASAIGILYRSQHQGVHNQTFQEVLERIEAALDKTDERSSSNSKMLISPLDFVFPAYGHSGVYARPTRFQLAQAVNRLRGLQSRVL